MSADCLPSADLITRGEKVGALRQFTRVGNTQHAIPCITLSPLARDSHLACDRAKVFASGKGSGQGLAF